jgi:DNA-binding IclR family transcriptional regulator
LSEPDSAAGLARRLGIPRQKVNYHLRELEREGFVELLEERRKGSCIELVVRATAREFLIAPHAGKATAADRMLRSLSGVARGTGDSGFGDALPERWPGRNAAPSSSGFRMLLR